MIHDPDRASRYRNRAAELRAVSTWMKDPHALSEILAMATEYDRMALMVDRMEQGVESDDPSALPTSH